MSCLPTSKNFVFLQGFMYFWSIVFLLTTTLVMLLKKEDNSHSNHHEESKGVVSTYQLLWRIVRLPSVLQYVLILLTCKVSLLIKIVLFFLAQCCCLDVYEPSIASEVYFSSSDI